MLSYRRNEHHDDVVRTASSHTVCLQAGLLAQQDSFVPFIWVAVQSVLNVVGDLILIMHFRQGLKGAAWATVLSQLVGTLGLLFMFRSRGKVGATQPTHQC